MSDEATKSDAVDKSAEVSEAETRSPIRKWRVFFGVLGVGFFCLLVFVLFTWRGWLTIAADLWVIDQPTPKTDALVVLGGSLQDRPFFVAQMYRRGVAPKVLVSKTRMRPSDKAGVTIPAFKWVLRVLKNQGVPEEAVELIGDDCASTFDEASALRDWGESHPGATILVPTSLFHTRRAAWILHREIPTETLNVRVAALPAWDFNLNSWWRHEYGLIAFQNEVVKYLMYRVKY